MSKRRKPNKGNPGAPSKQDRLNLRRQLAALRIGELREASDPEGMLAREFIEQLYRHREGAGSGLIVPGQPPKLDLAGALEAIGIVDADGLWRALEAVTTAATSALALYMCDDAGESAISIPEVLEWAVAHRPVSVDAMRVRAEAFAATQKAIEAGLLTDGG